MRWPVLRMRAGSWWSMSSLCREPTGGVTVTVGGANARCRRRIYTAGANCANLVQWRWRWRCGLPVFANRSRHLSWQPNLLDWRAILPGFAGGGPACQGIAWVFVSDPAMS